jgi:uncharacterized protein YbaA (DUF1428 family)
MLVCVMLPLVLVSPAMAAHHEVVLQVVAVDVKPEKLEDYQKQVKKLQAVLKRVGSTATMRMWRNTQGGPAAGTILVSLEFANAEAWAQDTAKIQADEEWQDIVEDLHELRTLEGSSIWTDISPSTSTGQGSVLVVTGVTVNPGKLEAYRKELSKLSAISERLGTTARVRTWHATLAGPNTGNVAVGAEYKDLATYVREQAKVSGDTEWQGILKRLNGIRTLEARSLYRDITP